MNQRAGKLLKCLYCLTVVAMIIPAGLLGASGWVGLAMGGGFIGAQQYVGLVIAGWFIYRVYQVVRFPDALDVYVSGMVVKLFRVSGIVLMMLGLVFSTLIAFVKPLTLAIFGRAGDAGIAYFVVGVFLYLLTSAGWLGLILFEIGRICGKQNRPNLSKVE